MRGDDGIDQHILQRADGIEFLVKTLPEIGKLLFVFIEAETLDEDVAGTEAVFQGVISYNGAACGSFRAGGFAGILPVGGDLFF